VRPLPLKAIPLYLMAEYNDESQWRNYIGDTLWAGATDMRFVKSDAPKEEPKYKTEPTMLRWSEIQNIEAYLEARQAKEQSEKRTVQGFMDVLESHL